MENGPIYGDSDIDENKLTILVTIYCGTTTLARRCISGGKLSDPPFSFRKEAI